MHVRCPDYFGASMLFLIFATIAGCSFPSHLERAYLRRIGAQSNEFAVPENQFDSVWGRAKWFVAEYSSMKIETMNDTVIRTEVDYCPFASGYGYAVVAHRRKQGMDIGAACFSSVLWQKIGSSHNTDIMVDYMKTCSLPFPELISK
jgi:hypothetical protein